MEGDLALDALETVDGALVPRPELRDEVILRFVPALKDALAQRTVAEPATH
jgi:hypothetical protein